MSDVPKRRLSGTADRSHADSEYAYRLIRADLTGSKLEYIPADSGNWVAPPPTTVGEAIDRIAAAHVAAHAPIP